MPTCVAKKCVDCFIKPLTYIINASFREGIFPTELKLARVVPIFKAGDQTISECTENLLYGFPSY